MKALQGSGRVVVSDRPHDIGKVIPMPSHPTPSQRFWSKVVVQPGCWEWLGGHTVNGYGNFWYEGRSTTASRFSYILHFGPIPEGLQVDHLCRNRGCVHPGHLELVTNRENERRGVGSNRLKTQCPQGHPYAGDNLYCRVRANGGLHRTCRICDHSARKKYDAQVRPRAALEPPRG